MRILIVSDTHGKDKGLKELLGKLQPVDMLIHCGDSEGSEDYIREIAACPVHIVAGNNDFFSELPKEDEICIGKYHVLLTHGHYYYLSMGTEMLKEDAGRAVLIWLCLDTHTAPVWRRTRILPF